MGTRALTAPHDIRRRWGANIRAARIRAGITPTELAGLVGVSRVSVNAWEQGRTAPSYGNRLELARVLGREVARLFPAA